MERPPHNATRAVSVALSTWPGGPGVGSGAMHLALATDAQKAQRDELTFSAWGRTVTPETYALRERRLRAHPWSVAGMKTWLLCADDGAVLASCETFRTDSFLRDAGGALVPGDSFAIASVFTEERLRGR